MSVSNPSIIETRRDQILPLLDATDIERAWRFGEVRRFATGEALAAIGEVGVGLGIILSGQVDVYRYGAHSERQHFYTFGPGSFLGELAQLAGRPSFGDAVVSEPVKALIFSPDRMRALLIAEAELAIRGARRCTKHGLDSSGCSTRPSKIRFRPATRYRCDSLWPFHELKDFFTGENLKRSVRRRLRGL